MQLIEDTEELGEALAGHLVVDSGNPSAMQAQDIDPDGIKFPPGTPDYLEKTWPKLISKQKLSLSSLTASYSQQVFTYREQDG